jgi:hypothetical protein
MFKDYLEVAKMGSLKASAGRNWSRKIAKIFVQKETHKVFNFPKNSKKIVF